MSEFAVEVEKIRKSYPTGFLGLKRKLVLEDISLRVPEGMIYGVLGPNGAGKTTLLSLIANLTIPDAGKIRVFGHDTKRYPEFVKQQINLCSGNPNFLWSMTIYENLTYYAMLYGLMGRKKKQRVSDIIALLELQKFSGTRFDELSTGTKQRLALAKALLSEPRLLFLDEPTIGLDPDMAIKMRNIIKRVHTEKGMTILMTSHYMKEVEEVCERVAFLRTGRLAAEGTIDELKKMVKFKIKSPSMEDVFLELIQ
ncbi:MAG: ABC transporter ATP-binding protein [bacterium]